MFSRFTKRLGSVEESDAFVALCTLRSFRYADYARIADLVRDETTGAPLFVPSREQFERLIALGIVNKGTDARWRVVYLARKLAHEGHAELTERIHAALAEFHQRSDDDHAFAEEVYHRAFLGLLAAHERWLQLFRRAHFECRIAACDALLEVISEFRLPTVLEPVTLWAKGEFSRSVGRLDVAREAWTKGAEIALGLLADPRFVATPRHGAAINLTSLAELEADTDGPEQALSRYAEARRYASELPLLDLDKVATFPPAAVAEAQLRAAIGDHEGALQLLTEAEEVVIAAHGPAAAGSLRYERAKLLADMGRYDEATALFEMQLADQESNEPIVRGQYGQLLESLGEAARAEELTASAQAGFQTSLEATPGAITTLLNSAHASIQRSRSACEAGNGEAAKEHASIALDLCDRGLGRAPNALSLHLKRGEAAIEAALAWSECGSFDTAMELVDVAEASLRRTLEGTPSLVAALNVWGRAAGVRGEIALDHGRLDDAERALAEAEARYARAAAIYPLNVAMAGNRTAYLFVTVRLCITTGNYDRAREIAGQMTELARVAPGNIQLLLNGGNGWVALAFANLQMHAAEAAGHAAAEALDRLRAARRIAPRHRLVLRSRAGALALYVESLLAQGRASGAEEWSRIALQAAKELQPHSQLLVDLVNVIYVHRMRAEAAFGISDLAEARTYIQSARELCAEALRLSSGHQTVLESLTRLANLAARIAKHDKRWSDALQEGNESLRLARQLRANDPHPEPASTLELLALTSIGNTLLK